MSVVGGQNDEEILNKSVHWMSHPQDRVRLLVLLPQIVPVIESEYVMVTEVGEPSTPSEILNASLYDYVDNFYTIMHAQYV